MDETRSYWIGFNRVGGIGAVRLRLLLDVFGDVSTAWHASESELLAAGRHHGGRGEKLIRQVVEEVGAG